MKKKKILIISSIIILLGISITFLLLTQKKNNNNEETSQEKIEINENGDKAFCRLVKVDETDKEINLIGDENNTKVKGFEEFYSLDSIQRGAKCITNEEIVKSFDKNGYISCREDGDEQNIHYEYIRKESIYKIVEEYEDNHYECVIYSNENNKNITGTWCWYNHDGTLVNGNYKLILNEDGTMKSVYDYGGEWGETSYDTYYSFDGTTFYYLLNRNMKLEYKYNKDDNTLRTINYNKDNTDKYYKRCD